MKIYAEIKRLPVASLLFLGVIACSSASASSEPKPKEGAPAWLSESLMLCFLHIYSQAEGATKAHKTGWEHIPQEYPEQLRKDMNYTKEIGNNGFLMSFNEEVFGDKSRKGCSILKLPTRETRVLPEKAFNSLTKSSDFKGEVVKFKACVQCLDDLAGHWSVDYLNETWAVSALSGARNDVTVRITPIN